MKSIHLCTNYILQPVVGRVVECRCFDLINNSVITVSINMKQKLAHSLTSPLAAQMK